MILDTLTYIKGSMSTICVVSALVSDSKMYAKVYVSLKNMHSVKWLQVVYSIARPLTNSMISLALAAMSAFRTTQARGTSPAKSSGTPTTAASDTAGCRNRILSRLAGDTYSYRSIQTQIRNLYCLLSIPDHIALIQQMYRETSMQ